MVNKSTNPQLSEEYESQYRNIFDTIQDGLIIIDLETGFVVEGNPTAWKMHGCTREDFLGQVYTTFVHPETQDVLKDYFRTFPSEGVFDIRTLNVCRDGSTFYAEWHGAGFLFRGRQCLLSSIRDVSKQIQAERLLQQQVDTRAHEQATLLKVSHILASTLEFHPGLILDQLREIIEFTHGGLFVVEGSELVAQALYGPPQLKQSSPINIHPQDLDPLAVLLNGHQPIRIADVWSQNTQAEFLRSLLGDNVPSMLEGMQSWMWVPMAVKSRILGGIGMAHTERDYYTPHHADLALSIANQAAITMFNTELYGQAQALAVLEERQHLAHNLHDAVNQSLFSAGLIAEVLPRLWDRDQDLARNSLEDLRRLTRGAQAEMRALLAELRPSTLTDSNLSDLIRLLGNAFTGRTNIPTRISAGESILLPGDVQVAFYRICQEGLNNIAKHAGASMVEIDLKYQDATTELSIRDDGRGFDPEQTTSGHYGLIMMHERAETMGGLLSITSQPGHGTQLTICWTNTPS